MWPYNLFNVLISPGGYFFDWIILENFACESLICANIEFGFEVVLIKLFILFVIVSFIDGTDID